MFRRSSTRDAGSSLTTSDSTVTDADRNDAAGLGGKGKATPKRRDAEAARRTSVIAPTPGRSGGRESRDTIAARREAMRRGDDDRLLSPRDRGPVRRFVRDYVDARRNVAGLFLPLGFPIVIVNFGFRGGIVRLISTTVLWLLITAILIDSALLARAIRREVQRRFPQEPTRGLGMYAAMRAMQFRKLRMPMARVQRGAKV